MSVKCNARVNAGQIGVDGDAVRGRVSGGRRSSEDLEDWWSSELVARLMRASLPGRAE